MMDMDNIKEEQGDALADREECEDISPKHCTKLQFSIAQIMGFDRNSPVPEKTMEDEDEMEDDGDEARPPAKLWRPVAQSPPATAVSGSEPAALALLRHYTLLRSRDPWRSLLPPYTPPAPPPLLPLPSTQHFRFPTFPFPESSKLRTARTDDSLSSLSSLNSSKQKTYPCPQCGKVFNAHYNLTRHMPVHTGNRTVCRHQFRTK